MSDALSGDSLHEKLEQLDEEVIELRQENRRLRQQARTNRLNEAKLSEVYKVASIFSWEVRTLTEHLECSEGLLIRFDDTQLTIDNLFDAVDADSREAVRQAYESCVEDGNPRELKHEIVVADGTTRTVEHYIKAFRSESGIPLKTVGLVLDVTEREHMGHRLNEAHERVSSILEAVGEGVYAIDEKGEITLVNAAAAAALGRDTSEMIGQCAHELFNYSTADGDPIPMEASRLHSMVDRAEGQHREETVFWREDGSSFPVACVSTTVRGGGDEVLGAVITFRDLTEERHQQAQIAQSQKLESIGQLAAGIAHEINTPAQYVGDNLLFLEESFQDISKLIDQHQELSAEAIKSEGKAKGAAASAKSTEEDVDLEFLLEEVPRALGQSRDGIERVAEIVRAMKEFSHPGSHEKQPIDLNHAIRSTITVATNEWKYVADVETDFDSLPQVPCLANELNQVVLNIVVNAAQALAETQNGEEKGRITVRTRRMDETVMIEIEDTGPGMPASVRNRIFDPFFTTKEVGKGTGQGLAIAHSVIVDKHGGTIDVESEVGAGTTFRIVLPLQQAAEEVSV